MELKAARHADDAPAPDAWVCFRPEKADDLARLPVPDAALRRAAAEAGKAGEFRGKAGETLLLHGGAKGRRLLLVGLGKAAEVTREGRRVAAGHAARALEARQLRHGRLLVAAGSGDEGEADAQALLEGAGLAAYRFDQLKSDRARPALRRISIAPEGDGPSLRAAVRTASALVEAVSFARDLGNLPGNMATPVHLAERAADMAGGPLTVRVHDRNAIRRMKMGAFSAVAQASRNEPRLIEFRYRGAGERKRRRSVALVGKGVTFDTGGISIKPAAGMEEMKFDMCGGAAVFGTMHLLKALKPKIDVHALVPATDNMPDGSAYRPGDILTARNGKTIEVISTDAEGRLLLCDALAYAAEKKPDCIVDLATLTGACVVALADAACGLFGNDAELVEQVRAAGAASGETAWPMPLLPRYTEMIRGDYADLKNAGGRWGGACTAAAFLSHFVDSRAWVHLDIAGTAWTDRDQGYRRKGATGFGVRLLWEFLQARQRG